MKSPSRFIVLLLLQVAAVPGVLGQSAEVSDPRIADLARDSFPAVTRG